MILHIRNHFFNAISVRKSKKILSKYTYPGIHLNIRPKHDLGGNIVYIRSDDEYISINLSNGIGEYTRGELSIEFYPLYEFMARDALLKITYDWAQEIMKKKNYKPLMPYPDEK